MAQMATQYTTLAPELKQAGGGSDHYPFSQYGYNFAYAEEGDFNTAGWHTPLDLTSRMNFPYMTDVVKMVLATGYAVSTYPGVVSMRPPATSATANRCMCSGRRPTRRTSRDITYYGERHRRCTHTSKRYPGAAPAV